MIGSMPKRTLGLAILLGLAAQMPAADTIEAFGLRWRVPIAADWKVESVEGIQTLRLLVPRPPSAAPRRPTQFALAETPDYISVTVEAEVKKEPQALRNRRNSLIMVYAWKDANHFNYAHLSDDNGRRNAHHNGIFHVFGGDRERISSLDGPDTLTAERWYKVRLVHDGRTGKVQVFVDGETSPSFQADDVNLRSGRIGLGSFFDTGEFRNVRIEGEIAPQGSTTK
jgi:hypothetical protein